LTEDESTFLGVLVLAQLVQAIDILYNHNWKGNHYLYIDEAGSFVTPQIDQMLSKKRKSGMRLILAHHFNSQIENKRIFDSVTNNARIKIMFNTPNPDDRLYAMKAMGYGGDITPLMASYGNQNLPKQYAIIKKNKETPVRVRTPDVKPYPPATKEFISKLLDQPFYGHTRKPSPNPERAERREASDNETNRGDTVPNRGREKAVFPDSKKPPVTKNKEPFKF
jgi:hypothetical protein